MSKFHRVIRRIVRRRTVRSGRLVVSLERWERLATPEERAELLARAEMRTDMKKAA